MQEQELPLLQLFRVATSRYNYEQLPCFQILECAASLKYFYFALLLIRLYNRLIPAAYAAPLWLDYTSAHAPEFLFLMPKACIPRVIWAPRSIGSAPSFRFALILICLLPICRSSRRPRVSAFPFLKSFYLLAFASSVAIA